MELYCVIGYPIKHSLSPKLHNRAFRKLKIPARYEAVEVRPQNLAKFMRTFREKYAGGNVTIPYKVAVMKFLDGISPEARAIGAVNTIVNRGGKLVGYNTDMFGAVSALQQGMGRGGKGRKKGGKFLKGKQAVILGAGGAARAVVYGLKKAGAKVTILNRTLKHAKKLAKDFRCKSGQLKNSLSTKCDVLINTTSVGMWREKVKNQKSKIKMVNTPLPNLKEILRRSGKKPVVMDIIYRPRMTKFLRDAKRAGCKIITGDHMFLGQAAKAFELWTRQKMR